MYNFEKKRENDRKDRVWRQTTSKHNSWVFVSTKDKYPNILYTKVSSKMANTNSTDQDQTVWSGPKISNTYSIFFWHNFCFLCVCFLKYLVAWQTVYLMIRLLPQESDLGLDCLYMLFQGLANPLFCFQRQVFFCFFFFARQVKIFFVQ